jgi:ABC-type histidine transport system ATPase subunit
VILCFELVRAAQYHVEVTASAALGARWGDVRDGVGWRGSNGWGFGGHLSCCSLGRRPQRGKVLFLQQEIAGDGKGAGGLSLRL